MAGGTPSMLATVIAVYFTFIATAQPSSLSSIQAAFPSVERQPAESSLPVVDLGYTIHQAISSNATGGYYSFSNIRFAAPPTGNDRFRAPLRPTTIDRNVTNGGLDGIQCPQAEPTWGAYTNNQLSLLGEALASRNLTLYEEVLAGVIVNATNSTSSTGSSSQPGTVTSEDCLFLDMVLPHSAWNNRNDASMRKAPVILWLHGGGYVFGSKRNTGETTVVGNIAGGLVTRSTHSNLTGGNDIEPTIVVLANYRLGMFGWLGGNDVAADGLPNTGLYDQKLAMEWIQKYIHLFGGDARRVTVMGESAGGGSIEHHITAYGGAYGSLLFQRAIAQSPTFYPVPGDAPMPEMVTQVALKLANVTCLSQMRELSSAILQEVNKIIVAQSAYGFFSFGPIVDGTFVPDLPGKLLLEGRYHKGVELLLGHNLNEGFIFTSPFIQNTSSAFDELIVQQFPEANASTKQYIEQVLYPPNLSGAEGYVTAFGRQDELYQDSQFVCNNRFLDEAFPEAHSYVFGVLPAVHAQDLESTFASYPPADSSTMNATVAAVMQDYFLSFAASGTPSSEAAATSFPVYGSGAQVLTLSSNAIVVQQDTTSKSRCTWWQQAPYST